MSEQLQTTIHIEVENVLEIARTAMAYNHFESVSSSILSSCSRLLKKQLTTNRKFIEFCDGKSLLNEDLKMVADLMNTDGSLEVDTGGNLGNTTHEALQNNVPANLENVDWIKLMDPNNGIPPDICFKIMESPQSVINTENEQVL